MLKCEQSFKRNTNRSGLEPKFCNLSFNGARRGLIILVLCVLSYDAGLHKLLLQHFKVLLKFIHNLYLFNQRLHYHKNIYN